MRRTLNTSNSIFHQKMASVDTSWLIIFTCQSPKVAGVTLDVIGNWMVQLFHHPKLLDVFSFLCKAVSECLSSYYTSLAPTRNKESWKLDSEWSKSFGKQQVEIISWLVSTLAVSLRKSDLVSIWCGLHKNFKGPFLEFKGEYIKILVNLSCPNLGLFNHTSSRQCPLRTVLDETYVYTHISADAFTEHSLGWPYTHSKPAFH